MSLVGGSAATMPEGPIQAYRQRANTMDHDLKPGENLRIGVSFYRFLMVPALPFVVLTSGPPPKGGTATRVHLICADRCLPLGRYQPLSRAVG